MKTKEKLQPLMKRFGENNSNELINNTILILTKELFGEYFSVFTFSQPMKINAFCKVPHSHENREIFLDFLKEFRQLTVENKIEVEILLNAHLWMNSEKSANLPDSDKSHKTANGKYKWHHFPKMETIVRYFDKIYNPYYLLEFCLSLQVFKDEKRNTFFISIIA